MSLCPYLLPSQNINKCEGEQTNITADIWLTGGTDLAWKSENNLVFCGLLWFGRNWGLVGSNLSPLQQMLQRVRTLPVSAARPSHLEY